MLGAPVSTGVKAFCLPRSSDTLEYHLNTTVQSTEKENPTKKLGRTQPRVTSLPALTDLTWFSLSTESSTQYAQAVGTRLKLVHGGLSNP